MATSAVVPPRDAGPAGTAADVLQRILAARFSCRAFRPAPVPDADLRRMFEMAQRTPSWCNSQAWQVEWVAGDALSTFAAALSAAAAAMPDQTQFDVPAPTAYEGVYRDRRRASGFGLYGALGIAREDRPARRRQLLENFRFFGAPHVAIVSTPQALGPYGAVDCGGYVTTLMLAAQSLGIASIAQAAIAGLAPFVHEHLGIPADRDILCAISFGYADPEHPANRFRTERAEIADVVRGLTGSAD